VKHRDYDGRGRAVSNVGLLLVLAAVVAGFAFGGWQLLTGATDRVCSTLDTTSVGCEVTAP